MSLQLALRRIVVMCSLCFALSGCFLNAVLSRVTVTTIAEEVDTTIAAFQASATVAVCSDLSGTFTNLPVECNYIVDGHQIGSTSTFISNFGLFGIIIDPIILQVPLAASNITGTFSGTSTSGNLVITEVAGLLDADFTRTITPEPGMKLVIVDFPDTPSPPSGAYGYNFSFQLPGNVNPVRLKALFAARVQSNGRTFYPPLLPCETNFANIPALSMPQSALFQNVDFTPMAGVQGCAGTTYRFAAGAPAAGPAAPIPTTHPGMLALLAGLLGILGVAWAGRLSIGKSSRVPH